MTYRYPRLGSLLALVSVSLLLSLALGFWYLGIAQTNLVRQTESELNTQAIFVAAIYRQAYAQAKGHDVSGPFRQEESEVNWQPLESQLTFNRSDLLPEQPTPEPFDGHVDALERQVGSGLVRILQDAQSKTLASIRIVNAAGVVVSSTNLEYVTLGERPEIKKALGGAHQAVLRTRRLTHEDPPAFSISRRADYRVHVAHPIWYQQKVIGAVVLSRTPQSFWQLVARYKLQAIFSVGVILTGTWMLMVFTSNTIGKPILALMEQAQRARRGEKGAIVPLSNPVTYEVDQLSQSVAAMARSLEARADFLLEASSHISHEFKTPMTALQGGLELLQDHGDEMDVHDRNRFINNMQQDVQRINLLVNRLLDYARADLKPKQKERGSLREGITLAMNRDWQTAARISLDLTNDVEINLDLDSIQSIFTNLIDNAVQAKAKFIRISVRPIGKSVEVCVEDDGVHISDENQTKIFDPFFTSKRSDGGTGLGLSIVQALVKRSGGTLRFEQRENSKVFKLLFPMVGKLKD